MGDIMVQTRTFHTETQYTKRAEGLIAKAAKFFDLPVYELDPLLLSQFIVSRRTELTPATYRQYKAAVLFYLDANSHLFEKDILDEAVNLLNQTSQSDCARKTNKTSQLRRKNFDIQLLNDLIFAISKTSSRYALVTANWLKCGALTGLRPHEWEHAEIHNIDNKTFLVVKNAKNTNGRSHGKFRHIEITAFTEGEMETLKEFLHSVSLYRDHSESGFAGLQVGCTNFLKLVNDKLARGKFVKAGFLKKKGSGIYRASDEIPKRITLYSVRHFFSSNAKSKMLSRKEIAALMGHKTDKTATEHYGKKMHGRGKFKVKPITAEVAIIQEKYKNTRTKPVTPIVTPKIDAPVSVVNSPKIKMR